MQASPKRAMAAVTSRTQDSALELCGIRSARCRDPDAGQRARQGYVLDGVPIGVYAEYVMKSSRDCSDGIVVSL